MIVAKKPSKINIVTAVLMVIVAIIFDLLSLIPILNIFTAIIAWTIFTLWFLLLGIGLMTPKRLGTMGTGLLIGLIPGLSALPELTISIITLIVMVKSEEKLGIKLPHLGLPK